MANLACGDQLQNKNLKKKKIFFKKTRRARAPFTSQLNVLAKVRALDAGHECRRHHDHTHRPGVSVLEMLLCNFVNHNVAVLGEKRCISALA